MNTITFDTRSDEFISNIKDIIVKCGGLVSVGDGMVRIKNCYGESLTYVQNKLKDIYGEKLIEDNVEDVTSAIVYSINTFTETMLLQFERFFRGLEDPFDFDECRMESQFGEHFVLSKDIKNAFENSQGWILCISPSKNRGIAMTQDGNTQEMFYIFFDKPIDFVEKHLPVVNEDPQAFDLTYHCDDDAYLIVPQICKC